MKRSDLIRKIRQKEPKELDTLLTKYIFSGESKMLDNLIDFIITAAEDEGMLPPRVRFTEEETELAVYRCEWEPENEEK